MIRSSRKTVANGLLIAALALLIPAAAGCEAGLDAPTLQFHPASAGAHAEVNGISINNVFVLGAPGGHPVPTGQSASLFLSLYNGGTGNDTLVSVSSPDAASSVQVTGGTVSLPVNSLVNLMGPQPSVVLSGLTQPLASGTAIPVTLDFQHAGSVTLDVPVQPQQYYYSTFSPPPAAPAGSPTPTPTGTATP
ncbi:MAG TPA: copper chaperone PCu(A)C [Trebonia sp.]